MERSRENSKRVLVVVGAYLGERVGRRRGLCVRWVGVDATLSLVSQQKEEQDTKGMG